MAFGWVIPAPAIDNYAASPDSEYKENAEVTADTRIGLRRYALRARWQHSEMGAGQSRLQKRSLRRRFKSIPYTATAVAALPATRQDIGRRAIRASRLRPLSDGMDRETAEALINDTLHMTVDLEQIHQHFNEVLIRMSQHSEASEAPEAPEPFRPLLPQFSFEQRPACPLWIDIHPACRGLQSGCSFEDGRQQQRMDMNPQSSSKLLMPNVVHRSRGRSPLRIMTLPKSVSPSPSPPPSRSSSVYSSASSYHSTTSRAADDAMETLPSLTASSSRYSTMDSSTLSEWIRLAADTDRLRQSSSNDHFLAPAIALVDELLDESVGSLVEAREVKLESHRGRGKPLAISVGRHDSGMIAMRGAV